MPLSQEVENLAQTALRAGLTLNVKRDVDTSNAFWGALFTFGCLPDLQVVINGPVGCYTLPITSILNYTDTLPNLPNVISTDFTEREVTLDGTNPILRTTLSGRSKLNQRRRATIVLTTQESELISTDGFESGSSTDDAVAQFDSRALQDDEWQGRDAALLYLYEHRDWLLASSGYDAEDLRASATKQTKPRITIIGPTYGCFNSYSDLAEIERLVRGIGAEVGCVLPLRARIADLATVDMCDACIVMYREFGASLATRMQKPYLYAPFGIHDTTAFLRELGRMLGLQSEAEAFIAREKQTTLKAFWDLWRSPHQDFFGTSSFGVAAGETYAQGLRRVLQDEFGMRPTVVASRQAKSGPLAYSASDIRQTLLDDPPMLMFGSINEKIYISELELLTGYIPASFPGPVVRRATGTPFMGYAGVVYLAQEISNFLFELLFRHLPVESLERKQAQETTLAIPEAEIVWNPDAVERMNIVLKKVPFFVRISASKKLRIEAEREAVQRRIREVTPDIIDDVARRFAR
ncbi:MULTISPECIES: nitrogenase component 1 [Chloracidobacterium]|uniref:Chlorophyllide reductase subunit Z n=1 Tax=Chloracidobacterium thermophilum (strain B) TaxID=981222 RepID=G2LIQ9_CHLTF|nr:MULTISPECIES: nitrogenase component 1 [Chloracidobacterium]AEP12277.1 chlorophyllide reductase subunit Z [Chloracidobacterium thermophilum B]QUV78030.1 chlorophyllide reductase subunit Z [Chloracidobacterium thermophilum]QUV81088.1 chlorophyllide reductase subunit Z [Chloracidobacterium sp. D]